VLKGKFILVKSFLSGDGLSTWLRDAGTVLERNIPRSHPRRQISTDLYGSLLPFLLGEIREFYLIVCFQQVVEKR
jgi:hypothetical protein